MLNPPSPTSRETKQWTGPLPSTSSIDPSHNIPSSPPHISKQTSTPKPKPHNKTPNTSAPPFRSVSACNRCRIRKHRCDQRLPRCESCEKAQVRCVGYDPLTKEEVPRSYVAFLENRVHYLSQLLTDHGIAFKPATPYDEEQTLKMEAGHSPIPESRGLRDAWRELPEEPQSGRIRKRKLAHYADDAVPVRQMKRLAQLNVLLTELITDGCVHRRCEREPAREYLSAERSRRRGRDVSLEQRLPLSPRSLDSLDHSDSRASPESENLVSLHETDRSVSGYGMARSGDRPGLGLDHGHEANDAKTKLAIDPSLVDFEFETPDDKSLVGGGGLGDTSIRSIRAPSHDPSQVDGCAETESKFDIAADLLQGRMERERVNHDLLDEFLVNWTD